MVSSVIERTPKICTKRRLKTCAQAPTRTTLSYNVQHCHHITCVLSGEKIVAVSDKRTHNSMRSPQMEKVNSPPRVGKAEPADFDREPVLGTATDH